MSTQQSGGVMADRERGRGADQSRASLSGSNASRARSAVALLRRLALLAVLGAGLLALAPWMPAAVNAGPVPPPRVAGTNLPPVLRSRVRPNLPPGLLRSNPRTNVPPAFSRSSPPAHPPQAGRPAAPAKTAAAKKAPATTATTNAAPAAASARTRAVEMLRRLRTDRSLQLTAGVALVCLAALSGLGVWLLRKSRKKGQAPESVGAPSLLPSRPTVRLPGKARRAIHSCNVLQVNPEGRRLWQFDARGGGFVLNREQTTAAGQPLPASLVARGWGSLFQRKLNIAWLPPERVFVRVVQLPVSDFNETLSMVELQLEKLSPMPVAQVVWTIQVLPQAKDKMQTVIAMIAARNTVEEFLGQLEGQGYLADALELPMLDQLQATPVAGDGAWIYPEAAGGKNMALVAWWYGGVLRNLDLITLPPANRPAGLKEQLLQMAWAGEMDGWLTSTPRWHLVADEPTAAEWEPALREGLEQPVEVLTPLSMPELAALTAKRSAQAEAGANLLPVEFSTRYQQQFVDRLWMRGLGAVVALYLVGVAIYGVALGVLTYRTSLVEQQVASFGPNYTNAIQLRTRLQVLQERQELKFAALDCWNAVAQLMPEDLTLDHLILNEGKKLSLSGTAPGDQVSEINEFEMAMRKYRVKDQPLFDPLAGKHFTWRSNPGGATVTWDFGLELKRTEALQ